MRAHALIVMGVAGSGKTTVGRRLARRLGWTFLDADEYHPRANVEKMARGVPLTDADRRPWLEALHELIAAKLAAGESLVMACSALKERYREALRVGDEPHFVHLRGDFDLIHERLLARRGHYMPAELLASQFEALEEPRDAIIVDIGSSVEGIVDDILGRLPRFSAAEPEDN